MPHSVEIGHFSKTIAVAQKANLSALLTYQSISIDNEKNAVAGCSLFNNMFTFGFFLPAADADDFPYFGIGESGKKCEAAQNFKA